MSGDEKAEPTPVDMTSPGGAICTAHPDQVALLVDLGWTDNTPVVPGR